VKKEHIPIVIYLMLNEADIKVKDNRGCSLVHWSAYKNNLFLVQLFES